MSPRRWWPVGAGLALFLAGLGMGWGIYHPRPAPPERYAPAVRQQDGSLVLEKKPQADAKPAQQVPKGGKVERVVGVDVRPRPFTMADAAAPIQPPDVHVDLSLVRMPDLTRRVVASSPDGTVVGGVDIPVEEPKVARVPKWAAGAYYGTTAWGDTSKGITVERDLGPFRVSADAGKLTVALPVGSRSAWEMRGRFLVRF